MRFAAFTLIELVLVVAVCAALAGLIIPSAIAVSNYARTVSCQSNLRQVGAAVIAYAGDHDDLLPAARNWGDDHPATSPAWFYRLPAYTAQRDVTKANSIFQCPAFRWSGPRVFTNAAPKSFKFNGRLDQDGRARHYRLGTFPAEHDLVLFVDGVAKETGMGQWGHCPPQAVDASRHRNRVNVLAMDGHTTSTVSSVPGATWDTRLHWLP